METTSIHPNKILILEDQRIIGFDLETQLKRNGYCVSYKHSFEDIHEKFLSGLPEIVISSLRALKNSPELPNPEFFTNLSSINSNESKNDTIIIDKICGQIKHFEKPYKTDDIISFVMSLMPVTTKNPKLSI